MIRKNAFFKPIRAEKLTPTETVVRCETPKTKDTRSCHNITETLNQFQNTFRPSNSSVFDVINRRQDNTDIQSIGKKLCTSPKVVPVRKRRLNRSKTGVLQPETKGMAVAQVSDNPFSGGSTSTVVKTQKYGKGYFSDIVTTKAEDQDQDVDSQFPENEPVVMKHDTDDIFGSIFSQFTSVGNTPSDGPSAIPSLLPESTCVRAVEPETFQSHTSLTSVIDLESSSCEIIEVEDNVHSPSLLSNDQPIDISDISIFDSAEMKDALTTSGVSNQGLFTFGSPLEYMFSNSEVSPKHTNTESETVTTKADSEKDSEHSSVDDGTGDRTADETGDSSNDSDEVGSEVEVYHVSHLPLPIHAIQRPHFPDEFWLKQGLPITDFTATKSLLDTDAAHIQSSVSTNPFESKWAAFPSLSIEAKLRTIMPAAGNMNCSPTYSYDSVGAKNDQLQHTSQLIVKCTPKVTKESHTLQQPTLKPKIWSTELTNLTGGENNSIIGNTPDSKSSPLQVIFDPRVIVESHAIQPTPIPTSHYATLIGAENGSILSNMPEHSNPSQLQVTCDQTVREESYALNPTPESLIDRLIKSMSLPDKHWNTQNYIFPSGELTQAENDRINANAAKHQDSRLLLKPVSANVLARIRSKSQFIHTATHYLERIYQLNTTTMDWIRILVDESLTINISDITLSYIEELVKIVTIELESQYSELIKLNLTKVQTRFNAQISALSKNKSAVQRTAGVDCSPSVVTELLPTPEPEVETSFPKRIEELKDASPSVGAAAEVSEPSLSEVQVIESENEPPKMAFTPVVGEGYTFTRRCYVFIKKNDSEDPDDSLYEDKGLGTLFVKPIKRGVVHLIVRRETSFGILLINSIITSDTLVQRANVNTVLINCIPTTNYTMPRTVLIKVETANDAQDLLESLMII